MHRDHNIGRERLYLGDSVLDMIGRRDAQMETSKHGVQFVHAGDPYGSPDRVQHAAMAAGRDDHEPASLHDVAGGVLVRMPIGEQPAAPLLLDEVIGRGRLDKRVGQDPLEGMARDVAGRKRALQGMRRIAAECREPCRFEQRPVERAPGHRLLVARADPFLAKCLLAACEELQVGAQAVAIMGEKPGSPP
jgi:hypothetical protein